jgi:hypothetical protein
MFLGQLGEQLWVSQRKEFELNLEQERLSVADLFQQVADDSVIPFFLAAYRLDSLPEFPSTTTNGQASQGKKNLSLTVEVGVKRSPTPPSFCRDVLNSRGLKSIANEDRLRCPQ